MQPEAPFTNMVQLKSRIEYVILSDKSVWWDYLSTPKLYWLHRLSLVMDKKNTSHSLQLM